MRRSIAVLFFLGLAALVGIGGLSAVPVADAGPNNFHCNQVNIHPNSLPNGQETVGWDPLESTCRHASLSIL